jgi:hypothetical protein
VNAIRERRKRVSGIVSSSSSSSTTPRTPQQVEFDLDMSFDLVQMNNAYKYAPPTPQVKRCLRVLVIHAIMDPTVRSLLELVRRKISNVRSVSSNESPSDNSQFDTSYWCVTSCMTSLQLPIYNFIRTSFRSSAIHASVSAFYNALDIWLIWLEPWNVIKGTLTEGVNCL